MSSWQAEKTKLTPAEQKQRRLAAQAARNRPRCAPGEHVWRQDGDAFGLLDGQRCTPWRCSVCSATTFVYQDRTDWEPETAP